MKRLISILLTLVMVMGIVGTMPTTAFAKVYSGTTYLEDEEKRVKCWNLNTKTGVLNVYATPSHEEFDVFEGAPWKKYTAYIKNVRIKDGVKEIWGFDDCIRLTNVQIAESVKKISYRCFSNCTALEQITLPDKLEHIGEGAFRGCNSLKSIIIPNSVNKIDGYAFYECSKLSKIKLPNKLNEISQGTFLDCKSLKKVSLPKSVTTISSSAFSGCDKLSSVKTGNNIEYIGSNAFWGCSALKNFVMPDSVVEVGENAFASCSKLKSVTFSYGILNCGDGLFSGCNKLTDIFFSGTKQEWKQIKNTDSSTIIEYCNIHCSNGTIKGKSRKAPSFKVKKRSNDSVKVTWKKKSKADEYEIQYSTSKDFKKKKTYSCNTDSNQSSYTFDGLKKGKTYYVRIRFCRNNFCSSWSSVKTIKL